MPGVIRDGEEKIIDAAMLVPGDIIRLEAGDFVPADARLLSAASLKSEESALTGESVPAEKDADADIPEKAALGDRTNMVFSGCSITYGTARAVVTATGMDTEMGKIANLLDGEDDTSTPLQKKLAQLGKYLGIVALGGLCRYLRRRSCQRNSRHGDLHDLRFSGRLCNSRGPSCNRDNCALDRRTAYGKEKCHYPPFARC